MSEFLSDTNIISELMRPEPEKSVVDWADEQESLIISVITLEEILCGLRHKKLAKKEAWFHKFVSFHCQILNIDEAIAIRAGSTRGRFLRDGSQRTQADLLIAATAWTHQLTLVTRNTKDFDGCQIPILNPFAL
ncbi:MAG: type II toxin-antitoxin system VapC family toxin [Verrucomicrobiota bacterium]